MTGPIQQYSIKKRSSTKEKLEVKSPADTHKNVRFGPMPHFPQQRVWCRTIFILGIIFYVWYTSYKTKLITFAKHSDIIKYRAQRLQCDGAYLKEIQKYKKCLPQKCGRFVSDVIVNQTEVNHLLELGKKAFTLGLSSGGASIFDLHTGALSYGNHFINVFKLNNSNFHLSDEDISIFNTTKEKIRRSIGEYFQIDADSIWLTYPTFFSCLTNKDAVTLHDEYWHEHVDKETYQSFHYTTLLYLSDYNKEFEGGRFIFVDKKNDRNSTIEPRRGRVSLFSSGAENPHYVERVQKGNRYAITISFTCDSSAALHFHK